ncbi:quinone oxidoreductase [Trichoderma arundinaceum]|uniref:Quinone oxidoreductase n=1 Tax=Trichoderma arundinaceum TaxID=490622 RepID=A0A395NFQ8_TRIAR|nr:quinone oxidoreductase [Trichoderma arundinaceum]
MELIMGEKTAQLQCTKLGGPFEVVSVPIPLIAPDQVLIRQRVIAINLVDVKQRDHESVGSDICNLRAGDEVLAWEGSGIHGIAWGGAFQERVVVPEAYVAKKPKNISLEEAVSLPICFVTAVCGLVHSLKIPLPFLPSLSAKGQAPSSILILGGSSATGASAIQLLRIAYPSMPILATSSVKHHERMRFLGATHVFDYNSPSLIFDIRAASPMAAGVDVILDCVSAGASQTKISNVFDPSGTKRYAQVITGIPVPVPQDVQKIDVMGWSVFDMQGGKQLIPSLTRLVEEGTYQVPLPVRVIGHGLEELPNVLDEVKTVSGEKLLVTL